MISSWLPSTHTMPGACVERRLVELFFTFRSYANDKHNSLPGHVQSSARLIPKVTSPKCPSSALPKPLHHETAGKLAPLVPCLRRRLSTLIRQELRSVRFILCRYIWLRIGHQGHDVISGSRAALPKANSSLEWKDGATGGMKVLSHLPKTNVSIQHLW